MRTSLEPSEAIRLAGSIRDLAELLDVRRQAVEKWLKDGKIPPRRLLELMQMKPRWFKSVPVIKIHKEAT